MVKLKEEHCQTVNERLDDIVAFLSFAIFSIKLSPLFVIGMEIEMEKMQMEMEMEMETVCSGSIQCGSVQFGSVQCSRIEQS